MIHRSTASAAVAAAAFSAAAFSAVCRALPQLPQAGPWAPWLPNGPWLYFTEPETRRIDEIYDAALQESGQLVVRWGGDEQYVADAFKAAFLKEFPLINITTIPDLSKYHDSAIDQSLQTEGVAGVDVAVLQTLQDFDRWRDLGELLPYKPPAWDLIRPGMKDPDGYYVGYWITAFTNVRNFTTVSVDEAPREYTDYLDPKWKGQIVLTYPGDDDAMLFQFSKAVTAHGWSWFEALLAQEPKWVRGAQSPRLWFPTIERAVSFTSGGLGLNCGPTLCTTLPKTDRFVSWPQSGAIFKTAKNKEAAKLFVAFATSKLYQKTISTWSTRTDIPPPPGYGPFEDYPTDPYEFHRFMEDRALVERLRFMFERYLGPPQGLSPLVDGVTAGTF